MAKTTVASQLAKLRKEREALEKKEKALMAKTNEKVLSKIVALAKDAGLTAEDVAWIINQIRTDAEGWTKAAEDLAAALPPAGPRPRPLPVPARTSCGRRR